MDDGVEITQPRSRDEGEAAEGELDQRGHEHREENRALIDLVSATLGSESSFAKHQKMQILYIQICTHNCSFFYCALKNVAVIKY